MIPDFMFFLTFGFASGFASNEWTPWAFAARLSDANDMLNPLVNGMD